MPRGPLPKPDRRRTNAPTIPTTSLPAGGRSGSVPRPPKWITLGPAGMAWWRWAWHTPQAAAWSTGNLVDLAHRAALEDDLLIVDQVDNLDVAALLDMEPNDRTAELKWLVCRLKALTAGRLSIVKQIVDMDKTFGLTAKGMADLRWTVVDDKVEEKPTTTSTPRRLRAVDTAAG